MDAKGACKATQSHPESQLQLIFICWSADTTSACASTSPTACTHIRICIRIHTHIYPLSASTHTLPGQVGSLYPRAAPLPLGRCYWAPSPGSKPPADVERWSGSTRHAATAVGVMVSHLWQESMFFRDDKETVAGDFHCAPQGTTQQPVALACRVRTRFTFVHSRQACPSPAELEAARKEGLPEPCGKARPVITAGCMDGCSLVKPRFMQQPNASTRYAQAGLRSLCGASRTGCAAVHALRHTPRLWSLYYTA